MKYRGRGEILYHGTSSDHLFEEDGGPGTPIGPAYFTWSKEYADFFSVRRPGGDPRVLEYAMVAEPRLFNWNYGAVSSLFGLHDMDDLDYIEESEIAKKICSLGYDGWVRECEDWEMMLCHPERFLVFVGWVGGP